MANPESASIVSISKVHARGDVLPGNRAVSYKKILLVENSRSDGLSLRDELSRNYRGRTILERVCNEVPLVIAAHDS